jgi:hypothetical protein
MVSSDYIYDFLKFIQVLEIIRSECEYFPSQVSYVTVF